MSNNSNNNKNRKIIMPYIFTKKENNNYKLIPLNTVNNTLGPTRYFPPAVKEWFNSTYAYNNNSIKGLSIADKNLGRIIKSYFNINFIQEVVKDKRISIRAKRLTSKRIFISKAELKHTSSKVMITLHIYNQENRILARKVKRLENVLFPSFLLMTLTKNTNKPLSLIEKLGIIRNQQIGVGFLNWLEELKSNVVKEIKLEKSLLSSISKSKLKQEKQLEIENLNNNLINLLLIISTCESDPFICKKYENIYKNFLKKTHLEKEMMAISYYKLKLNLNKFKFEDKFVSKLKPFISKIYNKEVEFKMVSLKTFYLNSDIFTQAISLKLKNRDNKLLNVLRSSLHMIKLPKVNRVREHYNKINIHQLWANKAKNLKVSTLIGKYTKDDGINNMLLDAFQDSAFFKKNDLIDHVLDALKHKDMAGARLEAKGRLTRRFTASRSVIKIKWKGSLKNIDSSYRGLSTVMLRGHAKSNVQYSTVSSKTRNGAYGLKGWVSSK